MTVRAHRIVLQAFAENAFDGEGAKQYGGRWNNKGTPMVYLASSLALAALELLVHLQSDQVLLRYVSFRVECNAAQATVLPADELPADWRAYPAPGSTKAIGDHWANSGRSLLLEVPSVVVPDETVYLLNPRHADFNALEIAPPSPFTFDGRLKKA